MVQYASDLALLGAVGTAAWQIIGGWYKFRASKNKRVEQVSAFEAVNQVLKAAAAKGDRPAADWGAGATTSGNPQVVAGWNTLPVETRVALVEDLVQVAVLTGQLSHIKAVREGRLRWSQLSVQEQAELLVALDAVTLDSLGAVLREQAPELAKSWLWQVTEVNPLLAEEIVLSEPCSHELTLLTKAFDKADKAVKEVLGQERSRHLQALSAAISNLDSAPASNTLKELKALVAGPLSSSLGPAAAPGLSKELRSALDALVSSEDGLLAGEAKEAARKLEAQAEAKATEQRLSKERSVAVDARATQVAHVLQVAGAPSAWLPSVSLALKLALVELVLAEIASAEEGDVALAALTDAARKLVPKLPVSDAEGVTERVQQLLAALGGQKPAAPAPTEEGGEESAAAAPAPSVQEAARELAALLASDLQSQLPATEAPAAPSSDEGVVASVVKEIVSKVVVSNTPGGLVAVAAAGSPLVTRDHVIKGAKEEAAKKAEAQSKPALDKIAAEFGSLKAAAASELVKSQLAQAEQQQRGAAGAEGEEAAEALSPAQRLALAALYIKDAVLAGPDSGLAEGTKRALGLLSPETEGQALASGPAAATAHALQLADQLSLAADVASKLELGPGLTGLLDRLDQFCAAAEETAKAAPLPNGHATPSEANGVSEEEAATTPAGESAAEEADSGSKPQVTPEQWAKARELVAKLLADGLVLLDLSPLEARKLVTLRTAVDGCQNNVSGDAVVFNRHLTTLKDVSAQLSPIMTAIETKTANATGPRQESLAALKQHAVSTYKALQELLSLEQSMRAASVDGLNEVREIVYGLKLQRSSAVLESGLAKLDGIKAKAEGVMGSVASLQGSEDAVSEVMVMEEQVDRLVAAVRVWSDWVRLREGALGGTPASPSTVEEDAVLQLLPVEELQGMHEEDAEFIDPYQLDEEEEEGEEQQEEGEEEDPEKAEEREAKVAAKLEQYCKKGYQLIARGQVAVVLLAGAMEGAALKITQDVGLPSTKSPLQLFAERLLKCQQLAAENALGSGAGIMRPLDWYIVLPAAAIASTEQYLKENAYFGLQPGHVHLVSNDVSRPAFSADLKVVMEAPGRMAKSPACSGDVWAALQASGHLKQLRQRGAAMVEVHAVEDNILARPADPLFVGAFHTHALDTAAKVGDPAQLMHVYEGFADWVATNKAAAAFSQLLPSFGIYAFSSAWLKGLETVLSEQPLALYRLSPAQPRAPTSAKTAAAAANPANTVAFRMDRHLSDWVTSGIVPDMQAGVVMCGVEEDFAPVSGTPPVYIPPSATHAVDSLLLLQTSWVEAAGGSLEDPEEGVVEVAPLVSYGGEGLEPVVLGKTFSEAYDLDLQGYAPSAGKRVAVPAPALTAPLAVAAAVVAAAKIVSKASTA